MSSLLCEYLDWDSSFFNLRIGRIRDSRLTPEAIGPVLGWAQREDIDCLYFLSPSDDAGSVSLAEGHGFRLVDIRVTFSQQLSPSNAQSVPSTSVRDMRLGDLPTLKAIAAVSHRQSRFYYDPGFHPSSCDRLYETWIERSCEGHADRVLVADCEGTPAGYLSCHLGSENNAVIGLLAVAPQMRGKGLGQQLVNTSLHYFRENGMNRVDVVTQGRNCPSQSLYQSCGFRTRTVQLWYHKWFQQGA
jgi:dTDP-4-amino-4,6-dideoxy-D-galactose acyltransferase